jgi:hypothetical protein
VRNNPVPGVAIMDFVPRHSLCGPFWRACWATCLARAFSPPAFSTGIGKASSVSAAPLVDVAIFILYLAASPELAGILAWPLGRALDRARRARQVLMRQLVRLFYGCAGRLSAATSQVVPETDLRAPTPAEFRDAVERRRLALGEPQTQRIGGKSALATFLAGLATPQFEEALLVAQPG